MTKRKKKYGESEFSITKYETGCPENLHVSSNTAGGGNIGHFS
jgi:hypothetical protein